MIKEDYEINNQEDEDLRCPICNYYFSTVTKPYLLPCNHNLCLDCINRIITKNMWYCPLCRIQFTWQDKEKFKVNFAFLNLVVKILKTKVIYCSKCDKIYNWSEHQGTCDQGQFKETNEIFDEIKKLVEDAFNFMKCIEEIEGMKDKNIKEIETKLLESEETIENSFFEKSEEIIEKFYRAIPVMDLDGYYKEILNFVKIWEPIYSELNMEINIEDINAKLSDDTVPVKKNSLPNTGVHSANSFASISSSKNGNEGKIVQERKRFDINDLLCDDEEFQNWPTIRENNKPLKIVIPMKHSGSKIIQNCRTGVALQGSNAINNDGKFDNIKGNSSNSPNFSKINYIISQSNNIRDITHKLQNYTRQIEFTSETIKSQIQTNYTTHSEKINTDLNNLIDNVTIQPQGKQDQNYWITFIEDTKKIMLYDVISNTKEVKSFPFLEYKFNSTMAINYNEERNLIFLSGGTFTKSVSLFSSEQYVSDQLLIFPFSDYNSINGNNTSGIVTTKIPHQHSNHSTWYFMDKLFIIGGENSKATKCKECDCYNNKEKIWEWMPSLTYSRRSPSWWVYKNTYWYVFRGDDEETNMNVEYINIYNIRRGWKCVQIEDYAQSFIPAVLGCACVINEEKIWLFGGRDKGGVDIWYTYVYNPIKQMIYRSKNWKKKASFNGNAVLTRGNKIVAIDCSNENGKNKGCHVYNVDTNTWLFKCLM